MPERFAAALRAAHGDVFLEAGFEAAQARLRHILQEKKVGSAAWNVQPPLSQIGLEKEFPGIQWRRPPRDQAGNVEGDTGWRDFLAGCDLGLTGATALLAETGSVVLETAPGNSRLVSLLPPVHVVLASTQLLQPDIFAWIAGRGGRWPANVVLISGPSKTGDIEQTLSVGVHGPKKVFVILYADSP